MDSSSRLPPPLPPKRNRFVNVGTASQYLLATDKTISIIDNAIVWFTLLLELYMDVLCSRRPSLDRQNTTICAPPLPPKDNGFVDAGTARDHPANMTDVSIYTSIRQIREAIHWFHRLLFQVQNEMYNRFDILIEEIGHPVSIVSGRCVDLEIQPVPNVIYDKRDTPHYKRGFKPIPAGPTSQN